MSSSASTFEQDDGDVADAAAGPGRGANTSLLEASAGTEPVLGTGPPFLDAPHVVEDDRVEGEWAA